MTNPHAELRQYLEKLLYRYLNTKSLYQQLKSVLEWQTPNKIEAFNLGAYFFELAIYSLSRTVLVELSMLLSTDEQRSLRDWLGKAKEHAASINPTRHLGGMRESIETKEYRAIIDEQIRQLDALSETMNKIKTHRDKAIAHLDKKYFNAPQLLGKDHPLQLSEIDDLVGVVDRVLHKHYSCLFQADASMEIESVHTVDTVLKYARAWSRARRDCDLIKKGFRPVEYERDDYGQNTGSSQA